MSMHVQFFSACVNLYIFPANLNSMKPVCDSGVINNQSTPFSTRADETGGRKFMSQSI